ncbi:MAG: hypothetical protein PCFJNLEI_01906 [Verrucomicrobiae bacterium]|nr:hypothetical protein [Verrucomicrobiae bacterium]
MAHQRTKTKTDLDVTGFLSIMSIVTGLICLILFVIALRIAMNPKLIKVVSFKLFTSSRADPQNPKSPSYIDCGPEGLTLYPGKTKVSWNDLQRPENAVVQMLDKIQANADNEYVIVMVRPQSVKFYRSVRKMVGQRPIDVGYDAIDADFKVDWDAAVRALGMSEE